MRSFEGFQGHRASIVALMVLPTLLLMVPEAMATIHSSTYSWQLSCVSSFGGIPGSAVARWNWTENGVSVSGSFAYCGLNNAGTATVPATANGIFVFLSAQIKGCYHTTTTQQSFAPGTVPRIKLQENCDANAYGFGVHIEATFTIG